MNDQQIDKLTAAIDRSGNGIAIVVLVSFVMGSCAGGIICDHITTEIRNAGHDVSYAIKHQECK